MSAFQSNADRIRIAARAARAVKRGMKILGPFLSSASENGFQSGYLKGLTDAYISLHGEEPPASTLAQWREVGRRKASGG